jgi:xylulokinase
MAKKLGLRQAVQVVPCGMDQVSSAIGGGNFRSGVVCETTGTALVISAVTDYPDYERPERITFLAHVGGRYLMLPYCPTAGMLLKWFRREFAQKEEQAARETGASVYELIDNLAETGRGWEKGLFLLPDFEGKLTPEPNPGACGVLFGLTLDTTRADIARALLESVGFMLRENIAMLEAYGVRVDSVRSLGGGAKSRLWGKIKADILQKPIYPQTFSESTSLGAAMLGQVAAGGFPDLESAFAIAGAAGAEIHSDEALAAGTESCTDENQVAGAEIHSGKGLKTGIEFRPDEALAAGIVQAYEQYELIYRSLIPAFKGFRR